MSRAGSSECPALGHPNDAGVTLAFRAQSWTVSAADAGARRSRTQVLRRRGWMLARGPGRRDSDWLERRRLERGAGLAGMERPLLKVTAASVAGEGDDPEVAVGALCRIPVDDF